MQNYKISLIPNRFVKKCSAFTFRIPLRIVFL
jgi:hypothetical protein